MAFHWIPFINISNTNNNLRATLNVLLHNRYFLLTWHPFLKTHIFIKAVKPPCSPRKQTQTPRQKALCRCNMSSPWDWVLRGVSTVLWSHCSVACSAAPRPAGWEMESTQRPLRKRCFTQCISDNSESILYKVITFQGVQTEASMKKNTINHRASFSGPQWTRFKPGFLAQFNTSNHFWQRCSQITFWFIAMGANPSTSF